MESKQVYALLLAAGQSTRFGSTKQVEVVGESPLARLAVEAASACGQRTVLILGHDWQKVRDACDPFDGFIVHNDGYAAGMASSIVAGARAVAHVADGIVVLLADQPLVTAQHVRSLIDTWSGAADEIVATSFAGAAGPPVLFPRDCFPDLLQLQGDTGGKHLLEDPRFRVTTITFEAAAVDVDTPDDIRRVSRNARS